MRSSTDSRPDAIARLTAFCVRHRLLVAAVWTAAIVLGGAGAVRLGPLLTSGFTLPGTDSSAVKTILANHYRASTSEPVVLVARGSGTLARVRAAAHTVAGALPAGRIDRIQRLPSGAAVAFVLSRLGGAAASKETPRLRRLVGSGIAVTGDAAIQHDLGPVLARDLRVGELYLAIPAALAILFAVFGTASALLPFVFAAATIAPALGVAWAAAHVLQLSDYLRNMVAMIGLGIAIDYSLLVVNRYRDERRRGRPHAAAVAETMAHAGRTIVFSGLAVSVGLALMLLLPVPFLRGFGLGGLLVPLLSIACAVTLLPVLLSSFGESLERIRLVPHALAERRHAGELRLWLAHSGWVLRRAKYVTPLVATALVLAALPLIGIHVGPASQNALPPSMPAAQALAVLHAGAHGYALDPTTIVVDTGRKGGASTALPAMRRLSALLRRDAEVVSVSTPRLDAARRYVELSIVERHDPASVQAQSFAGRLRGQLVPAARFPAGVRVLAGGGAAYAADFVSRTLGHFPWLVLGVLSLTYLLLVRAFRSLLLPLKAIVLNMLTVAAATGLMIAVFQWGWGERAGLLRVAQVEGWIPVFMFTLLFGLSMDYEVFLVSRMREVWEQTHSNAVAVTQGLASTGRIVTAAGLIMAATFAGMLLGSIPSMQQLGFGLAVAILIDITLVRGLLLPSAMGLAGRWNWYLPDWAARVMRVA